MANRKLTARTKRSLAIAGLLVALPGLILTFGLVCLSFLLAIESHRNTIATGLIAVTLMLVTVGAGGTIFWHSWHSLQNKPSRPIYLPQIWLPAGIFGLAIILGLFLLDRGELLDLFFPPILVTASALPPLLAVLWFTNQQAEGLTWRRGLIAFAGGATVSVFIALLLEILFPTVILALVFGLSDIVVDQMRTLLEALAGADIASAITSPGFIYIFVQVALIAPLFEELAKPLVTLPVIRYLSRREAFLVGALAGAGFATLENILYAGFGLSFWAGILLVRALGGAIHPLGSGLVALGWRDVLNGKSQAWSAWFTRFGLAVGMHALWNGGSLLVITLAGAEFFGQLPPEIDLLGLSAAGTTLALLIVLGMAALWLGQTTVRAIRTPTSGPEPPIASRLTLSNRAVAIWALACLVAIVPAGIAGLQLWVR